MIETRGLVKTYGEIEAVRGIDLNVREGEVFGFLGPNGAGKSTTISILCTLLKPTGGEVRVAAEAQAEAWRAEGFVVTLVDTEASSVEDAPPTYGETNGRARRWSAVKTTRRGGSKTARSL